MRKYFEPILFAWLGNYFNVLGDNFQKFTVNDIHWHDCLNFKALLKYKEIFCAYIIRIV